MLAPTASFIRIRFDANVEKFLSSLADYLASQGAEGKNIPNIITINYY